MEQYNPQTVCSVTRAHTRSTAHQRRPLYHCTVVRTSLGHYYAKEGSELLFVTHSSSTLLYTHTYVRMYVVWRYVCTYVMHSHLAGTLCVFTCMCLYKCLLAVVYPYLVWCCLLTTGSAVHCCGGRSIGCLACRV